MFHPGSIRRVQVKNFVTYTYAELYPGPHLNMIIGPNGTGKSTMVAAIILGLGGNPKIVGRGSKISEYVKHGCNEATINIFLEENDHVSLLKITRKFDLSEKSLWFINDIKKSLNEVLEVIKIFNIQVNNLCQFLPQDRVQDFAKMSKQELLIATQLALCKDNLVEKQEKLTEIKMKHTEMYNLLKKNKQKLVEAKESNSRLEGKVSNFNKKKKFLENIQHIDRKVAWIKYEKLKNDLEEIADDKNKAKEVYERHKTIGQPIQEELTRAEKTAKQMENLHSEMMKNKWEAEKVIGERSEKQDIFKRKIQEVTQELNMKLDEISQRDAEISATMKEIQEFESKKKKLMEKYMNDQSVQEKMEELASEIQKNTSKYRLLEEKRDNLSNLKFQKQGKLRLMENELTELENMKNQRLQKLYQIDKGVHEAVLWLRNNKQLFNGVVCEPMMLEINVLNNKEAIYLENVISKRDLLAFTCERKEDMNLLIKIVRNQKKLPINVLHSNPNIEMERYQPTVPIERMKKYGFHAYLDNLFTAPPLITHYLYKTYGIHNIPVGNSKVEQFYEQVPNSIRVFFSDKFRFTIKFSNYTGAKSTLQNQIYSNNSLSVSMDTIKMENLKSQIKEMNENLHLVENELKNYDKELEQCRKMTEELKVQHRTINDFKQQIQTVEIRNIVMKKKIESLKKANLDKDSIKESANEKIGDIVKKMVTLQEEISSKFISYRKILTSSHLSSMEWELAKRKSIDLQNKFHDIRRQCDEAEEVFKAIKEKYVGVAEQVKVALSKAKELSKGFTMEDEGFKEFQEVHDKLPDNLQQLCTEKDQILLKIDCLKIADHGELDEYEQREELIQNLGLKLEKTNTELTKMQSQIDKLEEEWLVPLGELVKEINSKFSLAFRKMQCLSEVSICTGEDISDYSKYGLSIKVSYRNDEPLQELNSTTQSGGERAVATAAFMLSLQELTPVPFRCVDEINQGMDSNNERRIFDLLLECTTQPNSSQYFLITPKLVPNLKYRENMAIHIVHNGPFVNPDRKWHKSKLCNPQGA